MKISNPVVVREQAPASQEAKVVASMMYLALMTCSEVQERIKISRAALYAKLNPVDPSYDPTFPIPVRIIWIHRIPMTQAIPRLSPGSLSEFAQSGHQHEPSWQLSRPRCG